MNEQEVKQYVKARYGQAAARISGGGASCCSGGASCGEKDPITANLYGSEEAGSVPEEAILASLGCGNPTALAALNPGEVVLDLGSGGGIDVLLSARRVGPTGKAYGVDMTDEMLALARENQRKAGVENVEFLKGEIESIPLPDSSVDVIISNCVINLSADKDRVLREAFRVLKPGGRFAISDVVVKGGVPLAIRKHLELWAGCIAGALDETEYVDKLTAAGFDGISIEPTRIYRAEDARGFLAGAGFSNIDEIVQLVEGKFFSAFVRAAKPVTAVSQDGRVGTTKKLQVFDPAMCCSSGVCGPDPDPVLPRFAADLHWLADQGVVVERYNLSQQPQAFAASEIVKEALAKYGVDCLPLIVVNDAVVSRGRYAERDELARFAGLQSEQSASLYTEAVAELVAIGAAIASNCETCFKFHFVKARKLGISIQDMAKAVETAQAVKESPSRSMLELANRLLRAADSPAPTVPMSPVMQSDCCAPGSASSSDGNGNCCS
ncbi:MAG: arsenite efflux transporter metallochaperone ArsD [Bryobacterales bacterium]|nr:arsenite efflux transporter metallochaperone ArsD [Bryobacterales bacterium]